jgi:quercetin dioxygenase-like cupin family protein
MFRGRVRARTLAEADDRADLTVMATTFGAGAHTVWHTHDTDQLLVVTAGSGELEDESGRTTLRAGDVVLVPRGRRHRHLAATDAEMTHLSVTAGGAHHLGPPASPDPWS